MTGERSMRERREQSERKIGRQRERKEEKCEIEGRRVGE